MPSLDSDAFRRSLKKGELGPAYYFHGDEDLLKDDALRELLGAALDPSARDFNLDRRRAAELSADDFETLVMTPPMLAERRAVVLTEVEAVQQRRSRAQALKAALTRYLSRPSPQTLLVMLQSAGEKPDAELARLAVAVGFDPLPPDRMQRWIRYQAGREGLELEDEAVRHLHDVVGDDLAQLASELSKLGSAVRGRAAGAADVAELVGVRRGETVHDFVDAVCARRFNEASGMIGHLLEAPGVTGVRIVSLLGTALVGVALARAMLDDGASPSAAEGRLFDAMRSGRPIGLRNWKDEAERWATDASGWTAAALDAALASLLKADRRLKSTSLGGEAAILSDAVLHLAGSRERAA